MEGRAGDKAGLKTGDIIVKINGNSAFDMKMEEIINRFYDKEGKRISLMVERHGQHYIYHFRLKDMLK